MYPTPLLGKFKITFSGARAHKVITDSMQWNSRDFNYTAFICMVLSARESIWGHEMEERTDSNMKCFSRVWKPIFL